MASTKAKERVVARKDSTSHSALPSVSVIVPTRNRADSLRQLLHSLSAQVYPAARIEVIVVDNESTDETEMIVGQAAAVAPFAIHYLRKQNDGPAASRNRGAEMATGDILAFTDSDCIPSPGWVRTAIAAFKPEVGVVCGPIHPLEIGQEQPFFTHQIHLVNREDGLYPTANVFYRRHVFLELGGFDEDMRAYSWGQPVGGDDTMMGWRVRRAGHTSQFADGAVVFHQATPVSPRAYLFSTLAAQILPKLVVTIPELRETCFYHRYFLHKQSAVFYLALLGLILSRKTPLAVLLAVPWLQTTWPALKVDAWPPKRWSRAALRLVLATESSAVLAATLLFSSARNRRLVL
ncbi:MAG: glycosyltransferase family A protein [Dehalococcoidia bacterium]